MTPTLLIMTHGSRVTREPRPAAAGEKSSLVLPYPKGVGGLENYLFIITCDVRNNLIVVKKASKASPPPFPPTLRGGGLGWGGKFLGTY